MGLTWAEDCALRYLLTGGDALTRRPPVGLGFAVVNNYGLSETTVVATSGSVEPNGEGVPSIGRPIAGVLAQVVDERLRPVEAGGVGELMIGGVAVGRGYSTGPISRPSASWTTTRCAGTARATGAPAPDGAFDFLGRLDEQLSIRGFRVEPGEVIAALNSHPAISSSVVVGVGSSSMDNQLVAYVVAAGNADHAGRGPLTATSWTSSWAASFPSTCCLGAMCGSMSYRSRPRQDRPGGAAEPCRDCRHRDCRWRHHRWRHRDHR